MFLKLKWTVIMRYQLKIVLNCYQFVVVFKSYLLKSITFWLSIITGFDASKEIKQKNNKIIKFNNADPFFRERSLKNYKFVHSFVC